MRSAQPRSADQWPSNDTSVRTGTPSFPDFFGAAEFRQIDDEAGGEHFGADLLKELDCRVGGAASGDEVVDQDDAFAFDQGILVHFHLVDARIRANSRR